MIFKALLDAPHRFAAETETGWIELVRSGEKWIGEGIALWQREGARGTELKMYSPARAVRRLHLRWSFPVPEALRFLGDEWERGYGDLGWKPICPERDMPWYVIAHGEAGTEAFGVMTQPAGFCSWRVDRAGVSLWIDVRSGGVGVELRERELLICTLRTRGCVEGESLFQTAAAFCRDLCPNPRLPAEPVYGGNDWYYAYGQSSHRESVDNARRVADWSDGQANRPFMVIDDGWQICRPHNYNGGPWHEGNRRFPDMPGLAAEMKTAGARPGLWFRPLLSMEALPLDWMLPGEKTDAMSGQRLLDPSRPEVLEQICSDVRRFRDWGFELLKHDFTTVDITGRWGFEMKPSITTGHWAFADRSRTTAEITLSLYRALREAAGDMLIIGCNTVGHLGAGLFELQRTGDDTSGREWERTRRMGINTLAFRMPQHNTFFAHDADCVGITDQVPWAMNRQWLDLLARSGTPLFVSAHPAAVNSALEKALRTAFLQAAVHRPPAEPLDWLHGSCPAHWRFPEGESLYDWTGPQGLSLGMG